MSLLVGGDFNLDVLSMAALNETRGKAIVALRYNNLLLQIAYLIFFTQLQFLVNYNWDRGLSQGN
jgi:hypothetical protein